MLSNITKLYFQADRSTQNTISRKCKKSNKSKHNDIGQLTYF